MSNFKLSIVIATYNAEEFLNSCLDSIIEEKTDSVELVIIDGGSTDSTLKIIKKYIDQIDFFLSEPDKGIYDAWNKAIGVTKGEWLTFIGSDDVVIPGSLPIILESIDSVHDNTEFIFSKAQVISNTGKTLGYRGKEYVFDEFKKGMTISHVFSLHRKSVFKKHGLFNLDYKICADYEFMLRYQNTLISIFLPVVSVKMMIGGMSFSRKAIYEAYLIRRKYRYNSFFLDCLYTVVAYIGYYRYELKKQIIRR
jgi:glycosyltransferase involved in cell wall biosynthesis